MVKSILLFLRLFKSLKQTAVLAMLMIPVVCSAQTVSIIGQSDDFTDQYISIHKYVDGLNLDRVLIVEGDTDEEGRFSLAFDLEEASLVEIYCLRHIGSLLVEPGKTYEVRLSKPADGTAQTFLNNPLQIDFLKEDTNNKAIRTFAASYNEFLDRSAYYLYMQMSSGNSYLNSRKEKLHAIGIGKHSEEVEAKDVEKIKGFKTSVDSFELAMTNQFAAEMQESNYVKSYITYTLANLKFSAGESSDDIFQKYIQNTDFSNPIEVELFRTFYKDMFYERTKKAGPLVLDIINNQVEYTLLDSLIEPMPHLDQALIRKMAVICEIQSNFYNKEISSKAMKGLLTELESDSESLVSNAARQLKDHLSGLKKGHEVESFRILNDKGEIIDWEDFRGQFVYVGFYANWCRNCTEELKLIETGLKPRYGKDITFVSVSLDEDFNAFKKHLQENRKQNWTFLYGGTDPNIVERFDIRTLPAYYLFDPDGKLVYDHTKSPAENVHIDFSNLLIELNRGKKKERTKVWDD